MAELNQLKAQFDKIFGAGGKIRVIRAPGRVNLIGEHTDYNDGFVFPMAIEPEIRIVCRSRTDGVVCIASTLFEGKVVEFSVQKKIEIAEPKWANYMRGVAAGLLSAGIPLTGMDALYGNTLPPGGGLSSSAAIEVGTATALLALSGDKIDPSRLALICQKAEHEYANMPCGIMDQTIVTSGRQGHAMLLDCRDLTKHFIPIDAKELRVVICNTMVKHELSDGAYAERRRQCEEGVAYFKQSQPHIKALRDVAMHQVLEAQGKITDVVFRRCRHVVGENERTHKAAQFLADRQYEDAGELMVQSHNSLRDDYEVSCPELDFLVEEAMKVKGVYGARMTGGGFGGCIVALVQPRSVQALTEHLMDVYPKRFKIEPIVFASTATAGAGVVE
jgi:galactokinase